MGDLTRTQVSDYNVIWGAYNLGFVDKVSPKLQLVLKEIKVGTLGDVVVGKRVIGLAGTVDVECREIDAATVKGLTAWSGTPAGSASPGTSDAEVQLVPATFHQDLYLLSQSLNLHPVFRPTNDTSCDLTLLHAVPWASYIGDRDGVADDKMLVSFSFLPDRTALLTSPPTLSYGYVG